MIEDSISLSRSVVILLGIVCCRLTVLGQIPDPDLGLRAQWMRGTWGINWKPVDTDNGKAETLSIDPFLHQIKEVKTIDYIQVHLNESYTGSPVHLGPHDLLESFWQGDTDRNGNPVNLVVPRKDSGVDPFLNLLLRVRAAGLKTQVYVNCSNMLLRWKSGRRVPPPKAHPDITERWKNWCDTNAQAQAFINSRHYHSDVNWPERHYMFCYAEFVLKQYAIRYGDRIDAWLFDSGRMMYQYNGDSRSSGILDEQRLYQAFADAVHAGNPDAAVAFNNGQGSGDMVNNPWAPATLFDDYMFGHPFAGGKHLGDHPKNYFSLIWLADRNGYVHTRDGKMQTWDDMVVGHFDPPMSTSGWNRGKNPALTNEEFVDWYSTAILGGGAVSLGMPLRSTNDWDNLLAADWALQQVRLLDAHLMENQSPDAPNWARQETVLPSAHAGQAYCHTLTDGVDFWSPGGGGITSLSTVARGTPPAWLAISQSKSEPGTWILSGTPTETEPTQYTFRIRAKDSTGRTDRTVELQVLTN